MSEAAKRAIYERRARFVAAALATAGLGGCEAMRPQPCLSQIYVPPEAGPEAAIDEGALPDAAPGALDASTSTDATSTLDSGSPKDANTDAPTALTSDAAPTSPRPCLSVSPKPRPCLSQVPDDE